MEQEGLSGETGREGMCCIMAAEERNFFRVFDPIKLFRTNKKCVHMHTKSFYIECTDLSGKCITLYMDKKAGISIIGIVKYDNNRGKQEVNT